MHSDDNQAAAGEPQGSQAGRYREIGLKAVAAAILYQGGAEPADFSELPGAPPPAASVASDD